MIHAFNTGLIPKRSGSNNPMSKLSEGEVKSIKKSLSDYKYGMCAKLAKKYGVELYVISHIKRRLTYIKR